MNRIIRILCFVSVIVMAGSLHAFGVCSAGTCAVGQWCDTTGGLPSCTPCTALANAAFTGAGGAGTNVPTSCPFSCNTGYAQKGYSCVASVSLPANATCSTFADDGVTCIGTVTCNSGYAKTGSSCSQIVTVPSNAICSAHADDGTSCITFTCNANFTKAGNTCVSTNTSCPTGQVYSTTYTTGTIPMDPSSNGEYMTSVVIGTKIYAMNFDGGTPNQIMVLDTATNTTSVIPMDPAWGGNFYTSAAVGSKLYGVGYNAAFVWIDTANGNKGTATVAAGGFGSAQSVVVGSKIYTINTASQAMTWIDTTTNTTGTVSIDPSNYGHYATGVVVGSKIYSISGNTQSSPNFMWFDTSNNTAGTPLMDPKSNGSYYTSAVVGSKIYAINENPGSSHNIMWIDTTNNTTGVIPMDPKSNGSYVSSTAVGSKIYAINNSGGAGNNIMWIDTTNNTTGVIPMDQNSNGTYDTSVAVGSKIYAINTTPGSANKIMWLDTNAVTGCQACAQPASNFVSFFDQGLTQGDLYSCPVQCLAGYTPVSVPNTSVTCTACVAGAKPMGSKWATNTYNGPTCPWACDAASGYTLADNQTSCYLSSAFIASGGLRCLAANTTTGLCTTFTCAAGMVKSGNACVVSVVVPMGGMCSVFADDGVTCIGGWACNAGYSLTVGGEGCYADASLIANAECLVAAADGSCSVWDCVADYVPANGNTICALPSSLQPGPNTVCSAFADDGVTCLNWLCDAASGYSGDPAACSKTDVLCPVVNGTGVLDNTTTWDTVAACWKGGTPSCDIPYRANGSVCESGSCPLPQDATAWVDPLTLNNTALPLCYGTIPVCPATMSVSGTNTCTCSTGTRVASIPGCSCVLPLNASGWQNPSTLDAGNSCYGTGVACASNHTWNPSTLHCESSNCTANQQISPSDGSCQACTNAGPNDIYVSTPSSPCLTQACPSGSSPDTNHLSCPSWGPLNPGSVWDPNNPGKQILCAWGTTPTALTPGADLTCQPCPTPLAPGALWATQGLCTVSATSCSAGKEPTATQSGCQSCPVSAGKGQTFPTPGVCTITPCTLPPASQYFTTAGSCAAAPAPVGTMPTADQTGTTPCPAAATGMVYLTQGTCDPSPCTNAPTLGHYFKGAGTPGNAASCPIANCTGVIADAQYTTADSSCAWACNAGFLLVGNLCENQTPCTPLVNTVVGNPTAYDLTRKCMGTFVCNDPSLVMVAGVGCGTRLGTTSSIDLNYSRIKPSRSPF